MEDLVRTYAVLWVWRSDASLKGQGRTAVFLARAFTADEAREQTFESAQAWAVKRVCEQETARVLNLARSSKPDVAAEQTNCYNESLIPVARLAVPVEADKSFRLPRRVRSPDGVMVEVSWSQAAEARMYFFDSEQSQFMTVGG